MIVGLLFVDKYYNICGRETKSIHIWSCVMLFINENLIYFLKTLFTIHTDQVIFLKLLNLEYVYVMCDKYLTYYFRI